MRTYPLPATWVDLRKLMIYASYQLSNLIVGVLRLKFNPIEIELLWDTHATGAIRPRSFDPLKRCLLRVRGARDGAYDCWRTRCHDFGVDTAPSAQPVNKRCRWQARKVTPRHDSA